MTSHDDQYELATRLVAKAMAAGADAADALLIEATSISVSSRLGKSENLERATDAEVGLRVFIGKRQAMVASSDLSAGAMAALVVRSLEMAREVPEDTFCGLAEADEICLAPPEVDSFDANEMTAEALLDAAMMAEDAARSVAGVTNSEGAEASWGAGRSVLAASNGLAADYRRSWHTLAVSVLAESDAGMERDYDYTSAVYAADLRDPQAVGRSAGERAVRRLNPRRVGSSRVPVVFDPRASRSLVGHLAGAVNGSAIARGTSFLKDKMGARIFPIDVDVIDDPLRARGLRSRPIDHEGIATKQMSLINHGALTAWLLDLRSARQLGLRTTGHAARGTTSAPSPTPSNLYLAAGMRTPDELIADIKDGLYVTELIGFGVNPVTGDYSRGASGFWIENGALAYPVNELTIAGTLLDMFANMSCANDLEFRYGTDAPTVRIDGMTLAGR